MSEPQISIVLATSNRARRLAALVDSLRAQTLAPDRFEVVVVDDASTDDTPHVLKTALEVGGLRLKALRLDRPSGPAHARNVGWRAAEAPLIAFTDDDCVATPTWAHAALEAFARHPNTVIQGRVEINPDEIAYYDPFAHTLEVHGLGAGFETANVLYPRELLERVNGFDEAEFRGPGGEDTDLAWRAIASGADAVFADDVVVYHGVLRVGAIKRLKVAARWTESIKVFNRHPAIRRYLVWRVFWRYNHWLFFRFLVALALPRRLGALRLFLAAPYVVHLTDRRTGPLLAPYLVALDAVEVFAVLRGALRYRTPVL